MSNYGGGLGGAFGDYGSGNDSGGGLFDSLFNGGSSRSGVSAWRSEWSNVRSLQDQIDNQMALAASHQQRVSSQLAKVQGDLSHRVDRLSQAFDAFVELGELRDTLGLYTEARRWRMLAKTVIEGAVSTRQFPGDVDGTGLDDVAGYWLVPAIKALPGILGAEPDSALLGEAIARDELRTATFVSAVAPLLGHPEMATNWIDKAMRSDDGNLTHAQRVLWLAAIDGTLPDGSVAAVRSALAHRISATDTDARTSAVGAAMPVTNPPRSATAGARAAAAAATVRQWLEWASEFDARAGAPRPALHGSAGAQPPSAPADTTADALLDVVRSLVEEGSIEERDLLDRSEALRATIAGTPVSTVDDWDDDAGTALALLCGDLRVPSAGIRAARFAARILGADLHAVAAGLLAPTQVAPATKVPVDVLGGVVHVSVEGGDPAEMATLLARNGVQHRPFASPIVLGIAAVTALVLIVLGAVVSGVFFVLAGIVVVAVAGTWMFDRSRAAATARQHASTADALQTTVQRATSELAAESATIESAAVAGVQAHGALMSSLAVITQ